MTHLQKLMTSEQVDRLAQIAIQRQGIRAFEDTWVTSQLGFAAVQREQIQIIKALTLRSQDRSSCDTRECEAAILKQVVEKVLTKKQKDRWYQIIGPPRENLLGKD